MRAGIRTAALAVVALALAACASDDEISVDPVAALPSLSQFPAGYSMIGNPESFDSALPGAADRLTFTDERCRVLIEPPAGAGAGESVSSGARSAVYLVYVVASDQAVSDIARAAGECARIDATSERQTLALARGTAPAGDPVDTIGYRYAGTQGVRGADQRVVDTPMVQERLVGRVGEHLVTASVTLLARSGEVVTEAELEPESAVLRAVFDQTLARLGG